MPWHNTASLASDTSTATAPAQGWCVCECVTNSTYEHATHSIYGCRDTILRVSHLTHRLPQRMPKAVVCVNASRTHISIIPHTLYIWMPCHNTASIYYSTCPKQLWVRHELHIRTRHTIYIRMPWHNTASACHSARPRLLCVWMRYELHIRTRHTLCICPKTSNASPRAPLYHGTCPRLMYM